MELVAENGFIVSIPQGCKKDLGRGSELAICDKTVSRHQILLELQERSVEVGSMDHDTSHRALSVKVLGVNPVCIVHIRQSIGRRRDDQEMVLLKKGEMDTLSPGDKISLSLSLPMFLTVREGEGRKNIAGSKAIERPGSSVAVPVEAEMLANAVDSKQLAEDDLLGKWNDRKKKKETEPCISHGGTARTDAFETRCVSANKDLATIEEEAGIAQAVARRQRRALERRQQQEQKLQYGMPGPVKETENVCSVQHEVQELEDSFVKTESIDPVKEFGFLVEGSEFEQYKNSHKAGGRWVWPPAKLPAESISDEDDEDKQEKHTRSSRRKVRTEEDDEEWRGDDQEEVVSLARTKKHKAGAKVNLRSHEPSSSKNRKTAVKKESGSSGMAKDGSEETEDEADETLGGFIVSDEEEEDPIDDDADDEEEESSDDEEIDDTEEEDEDAQQQRKEKKREEKPLCKYGKKCYRKNLEHLAQFRH
eukprot:c13033_g1_i1 orf=380-1813(-)